MESSFLQRCICMSIECVVNVTQIWIYKKVVPMLFVTFSYSFSFFIQTKHIFQVLQLALDGQHFHFTIFLHCPIAIVSLHQRSHRRFSCCKNYMAWLSHTMLVERKWQNRPFFHHSHIQTIYSNEGKYKFFFNI